MGVRACKRVSERFGSPAGGSHEEGRHKMKGVVVVSVCRERFTGWWQYMSGANRAEQSLTSRIVARDQSRSLFGRKIVRTKDSQKTDGKMEGGSLLGL